jgi:uridine kinase
MDCFYKILNRKQHEQAQRNEYNFDHPDAFDFELMIDVITKLKEGRKVEVPVYNFVTHSREVVTKTMYGANVIIFEGILTFHSAEVLEMLDMKIFVDTDADIRLARRLKRFEKFGMVGRKFSLLDHYRDISQRGRDLEGVLKQYSTMVKPSYSNYIAPTMVHADIIVPRGGDNKVAIQLIVQHVNTQLQLRGFKVRETLAHSEIENQPMPNSLFLLPETPQVGRVRRSIRRKQISHEILFFSISRLKDFIRSSETPIRLAMSLFSTRIA